MKTYLRLVVSSGLLAATIAVAQARIERTVERTFTVRGAGTLRVETHGGEIRVLPSADVSAVKVTARQKIRAADEAEANELLQGLELTIEQQGDDIRARARYARRPVGSWFRSWPPVQVDFEITVPARFAADLHTSGGGINVAELIGNVSARTSGGSIKLGRLGGRVEAETSGGNITLEHARGAVDLETSGGNITVGHVAGPAELSTSGGNVSVESVVGALHANTSGGNIRAALVGPLTQDCRLTTSGGSVRVTVDPTAAFQLDAAASGGRVSTEGLVGKAAGDGSSKVAGPVNGGGPLLKLRTSGGSIAVRTR